MQNQKNSTFILEQFEGSLDLLWHLIHRSEIDICEIPLQQITHQCRVKLEAFDHPTNINIGADFVSWVSTLLHYKSTALLPTHEQAKISQEDLEMADPQFEVIHYLLDYCRFKQAGKNLSERELQQNAYYTRGIEHNQSAKKHLGVDHLSLNDLASLFQQLISKTTADKASIQEETWKVSDKIKDIRGLLAVSSLALNKLFNFEKSRDELIVTFLALLELMKTGEALVIKDQATLEIFIWRGHH